MAFALHPGSTAISWLFMCIKLCVCCNCDYTTAPTPSPGLAGLMCWRASLHHNDVQYSGVGLFAIQRAVSVLARQMLAVWPGSFVCLHTCLVTSCCDAQSAPTIGPIQNLQLLAATCLEIFSQPNVKRGQSATRRQHAAVAAA